MSALDALVDVPEIRYIVTRHEQATTYMADGYARAGGRPGVAMVVPGVGVYNAASGTGHRVRLLLAGAAGLRAGQPPRHRPRPRAAARRARPARHRPSDHQVGRAHHRGRRDRRRGARGLRPDDIPDARAPPRSRSRPRRSPSRPPRRPARRRDTSAGRARREPIWQKAAELLAGASSPLIIAGGGVVLGDAGRGPDRLGREAAGARSSRPARARAPSTTATRSRSARCG